MFKKGDTIIYPVYGLGEVAEIVKNKFKGEEVEYYRIVFDKPEIDVEIPVQNAEKLGVRKPLTRSEIKKLLNSFDKTKKIEEKSQSEINDIAKDKMRGGKLEDLIETFNLYKGVKKVRAKDEKDLTDTQMEISDKVLGLIDEEVKYVMKDKAPAIMKASLSE
jgi:CarD family transcriptional regulator